MEPGSDFVFEKKIKGGTVPIEYIPAVEAGVKEAMESGSHRRLPGGGCEGHPGGRFLS